MVLSGGRENLADMGGKTSGNPKKPMFYATPSYKLWMRARMSALGMTLDELARRMRRVDPSITVTTSALSQFRGRLDEEPEPSNTELMPAINKVLGAAPPPICDPTSDAKQIQDRIAARWARMSQRDRDLILRMLEEDP